MNTWDVFLSDRLQVLRGLDTAGVRAGLKSGEFREDDLIRPAGSSDPWVRLADLPELLVSESEPEPELEPEPEPEPPTLVETTPEPLDEIERQHEKPTEADDRSSEHAAELVSSEFVLDDEDVEEEEEEEAEDEFEEPSWSDEIIASESAESPPVLDDNDEDEDEEPPQDSLFAIIDEDEEEADDEDSEERRASARPQSRESQIALPVDDEEIAEWEDHEQVAEALEEDEDLAAFSLAPDAPEPLEELDLTAMVDVAFQLILFFLVTATSMYFKTLEIPAPNPDERSVATRQARTLEDLEEDYILVNIDPRGSFTIDHEPVTASLAAISERLRNARGETGRTSMLVTADSATILRYAVLAIDAANENGLQIAIARPTTFGVEEEAGGE